MRDYGKVHSTFWSSATITQLSDDGKLLSLYLMTCGHGTIAGVFRLPDGYIAEDLGETWSPERVRNAFDALAMHGFAMRCPTSKWVWIVKHLEWNKPENPNQRTAARKVAVSVPDGCSWRMDFLTKCATLVDLSDEQLKQLTKGKHKPLENGSPKGSGTVIQLLPQEQKQEQQQEQESSSDPQTGSEPVSGFAIPLNDGSDWPVPPKLIDEWRAAFPAVDVEQELREMRVWSNAKPANRKTTRGVNAFIVRWLAKAQDTPARHAGGRKGGHGDGNDWSASAI